MAAASVQKQKFPRAAALDVARELVRALEPVCDRIVIAGSLRRRKPLVGDVEVLYIPKHHDERDGLFDMKPVNEADRVLDCLIAAGVLKKRTNTLGSVTWGDKNKLAVHAASGIPVDLFSATADNWFNYLVCRTGSAETNTRIATAAKAKGWHWDPYSPGFTALQGDLVRVTSELDVFAYAGLPYLEPHER